MGQVDIKTKAKVDAIISGALGKAKIHSMSQLQNALANEVQNGFRQNEYLNAIKNQIARIQTVNMIKLDVPIFKHFYTDKVGAIGNYLLQRQVMLGRASDYSKYLNVNDHYNPKVKEQIMETVWRKRFDLSISADIMAAAFQGYGEMNDFISNYMDAIDKVRTVFWNMEQLKAFMSIPLTYKMQSDATDGVAVAKELWQIISKMGMLSTKFNMAGLPNTTQASELILILNAKYSKAVQFDSVGGVFNFKDISHGGTIKAFYVYDFPDGDTIGCLVDKNAFYFDRRLSKTTDQEWAKTLIKDSYFHEWLRGLRSDFGTMLRLLDSKSTVSEGDTIMYTPFTHYTDEEKTELVVDDAKIVDLTEFINAETLPMLDMPTNLQSLLPHNSFDLKGAGATPTDVEITDALKAMDFRFDPTKVNVSNITTTGARITAIFPYVVNSFKDYVDIRFTYSTAAKASTTETK